MALNFLNGAKRKRDQVVSIDLGGRTTKAVKMNAIGGGYELSRFAVMEAPVYDKGLSSDLLCEHLKSVCAALDPKVKSVTLALGVGDSLVRHAEVPLMPVGDMRQVLKINSKNYLQQDLPGHVFDCCILPPRVSPGEKPAMPALGAKTRILAAGARKQLVTDIQTAVKNSGLAADAVVPGLVGPVNAFELAMPEVFAKEAVALVDIGFRNTSISLLRDGELILSRVVDMGGDKLTAGLAEAMGISYAEAESIKVGIPGEVESQLQSLIHPLARELRASIDCFEHQQDRAVTQVFVSGGTTRSQFILQSLQAELMLECKPWSPIGSIKVNLPPEQSAEIEQVGPQLTVAIGAALAAF